MALGGLVLGSLVLYLKGTRIVMFQLSGFYYRAFGAWRLQYPLLKEYTLNHVRDPTIIYIRYMP